MSDEFIKPSELVEIIKDTTKVPGKDYLVVDVRDDDYEVNTCQLFKIIFLYQKFLTTRFFSIYFLCNLPSKQGGNIPNSINSPSTKFLDDVDGLISKYNQGKLSEYFLFNQINLYLLTFCYLVPRIVFTCALSQVRGPKCARIFKEVTENMGTNQKVQVLQGGISEWQSQNKADPKLIENYDPDYWE